MDCTIYNILNPRRVSLFYLHKEKGVSEFGSGPMQDIQHIDYPRRVSLSYSHKEKSISGFGSERLQYIRQIECQRSFFLLFTFYLHEGLV